MKSHWKAGQFKLKGKKCKLLNCGCCVIEDFREKVKKKFDNLQIKEYNSVNND